MKKFLFFLIFLTLANTNIKINAQENEIKPEIVQDTLITTLYPHIKNAMVDYYGYTKSFDLFNIKIKSITRKNSSYKFDVVILIKTFEHAHNPPYGKDTIVFEITLSDIKTISYSHEKDKYEILIENFYKDTINDIKQSFNLDLSNYIEYNSSHVYYLDDEDEKFNTLSKILLDIVRNKIDPKLKSGYKNTIDPVTYIKENKGLILFKLSDGTNIVYKIKLVNDSWIVEDVLNKKGKEMPYDLLWYM